MKKAIPILVLFLVFGPSCQAEQGADNSALFPILHHFSSRDYAAGQLTAEEVNTIVLAGLRAPSAGNRQPWLFTVVQDHDLANQILPDITEGNILIVGSGVLEGPARDAVILDAGLAAQSMFFASQALGLGARQYTNPGLIGRTNALKAELGIPADHSAIIVTRFGRLPAGVDVVGSASPRAEPQTRVIYR